MKVAMAHYPNLGGFTAGVALLASTLAPLATAQQQSTGNPATEQVVERLVSGSPWQGDWETNVGTSGSIAIEFSGSGGGLTANVRNLRGSALAERPAQGVEVNGNYVTFGVSGNTYEYTLSDPSTLVGGAQVGSTEMEMTLRSAR